MESKIKLVGHPAHPILVVFPLGLTISSVIFDLLHELTGDDSFATVAYWNIVGGVLGAAVAALFGFIDWLAIPGDTRAKRIGLFHGGGNVVLLLLFLESWFLRRGTRKHRPTPLALLLSIAGAGLGGVTGWLGGELVDRLGVGVDEGAHLNAPSSLSGRPASLSIRLHPQPPL